MTDSSNQYGFNNHVNHATGKKNALIDSVWLDDIQVDIISRRHKNVLTISKSISLGQRLVFKCIAVLIKII